MYDNVKVISSSKISSSTVDMSPSSRRAAIENIAREQHRSIESIELEIANLIEKSRQDARAIAGNYYPGVHIVPGTEESRINPDAIKYVPNGSLVDFKKITGNSELRSPKNLANEKSLYIEPTDLKETGLVDVNMVGYQVSGGYLNGSDYTQTDVLRKAEATPSGRSGWTGLTRVYAGHATLDRIILDESDTAAARLIVLIPDNTLNSRVGPYRATLGRFKSDDGTTMSDLSWINDAGRSYNLKISQIDDRSVGQLMLLADKIARQAP